jgi:macrolide transport system ATP-binding/permease protein
MWNDVRFALRRLRAAKGFTITAALTLALGIGANTGIFTLIHAIMLKSLPVADPERLVRIGDGDNCCVLGGMQGQFSIYSYPLYRHLRDHAPGFEDIAAFQAGFGQVGVRRAGANVSEPFVDQFVSGNYFTLFGLRPFAGRLIAPSDDLRGAPPVAVMSYRLWRQRFDSDPAVINATFGIDGAPFTVIGIAPPGFYGAILRPDPPDFWLPLAAEPATHGRNALLDRADNHWLYALGRIKPNTPLAPVEAKLNLELRNWLNANIPASDAARKDIDKQHITLAPGGAGVAHMREYYRRDLTLLIGITGLVLLIACANLANLQLARGAANAGQTSIRVALGAPRSRLIRQVLIESSILAIAGGVLGLVVAVQTAALLMRLSMHSMTYVPIDTTPSLPVLGFAFLLSVITGVVFGIAPAWSASRADPAAALHGAGRSGSGRSTLPQKTLVVLQAALSLVLLAAAGLMVQTLRNLTNQQFGFRMEGAVVANVNAGFGGYAPEKLAAIYGEVDRQLRQIPGVRNVALTLYSPMSGNNWQSGATLEDRPDLRASPSWDRVSPSFFDTVGARILHGRAFNDRDTPDATHVAVVNQAFVDTYLANVDPLGKRFGLGGYAHRADYTIVGVVNTIRFRNPRGPGRPMFFLPMLQMSKSDWEDNGKARSNLIGSIVLRVEGNPPDLAPRIQGTLGSIDPNLTMLNMQSMGEMLDELLSHEQLIGVLAQVFGILALVLASVGLYGITAYSVARRTSEIGLRTALGATRGQVVRLILHGALTQTAIGLLVGIPAALAAGRLLADQVYGVKTSDPLVLVAASLILGLCAAVAGLIPAIRASSVDPVTALRVDN